jgi:hypothetical protein
MEDEPINHNQPNAANICWVWQNRQGQANWKVDWPQNIKSGISQQTLIQLTSESRCPPLKIKRWSAMPSRQRKCGWVGGGRSAHVCKVTFPKESLCPKDNFWKTTKKCPQGGQQGPPNIKKRQHFSSLGQPLLLLPRRLSFNLKKIVRNSNRVDLKI